MSTYETPENFDTDEDVIDVITQLQAVVPRGNGSTSNRLRGVRHVTREELKDVLSGVDGYVAHCRDNISSKDS